jgi:hypothetical protein
MYKADARSRQGKCISSMTAGPRTPVVCFLVVTRAPPSGPEYLYMCLPVRGVSKG